MTDTKETAYCQEGKSLATCPVHRNPSLSESEEAISMEIHEILSEKINAMGEVGESDRCRRRYVKTCPYYVSEPSYRRFTGKLEDVGGEKIRRQSIFAIMSLIGLCTLLPAFLVLPFSMIDTPLMTDNLSDRYGFLIFFSAWLVLSGITYAISLCNRHWFGGLVAVINKEGLYINTRKIEWEEIKKIIYVEKMPSIVPGDHIIQLSYINVECMDDQEYRIYHPSRYLLNKIKEHAANAEICVASIRRHRILYTIFLGGAFAATYIFLLGTV